MPISGVVITSTIEEKEKVLEVLGGRVEVEVHGDDEKGNVIAVLETSSSEEMEALIQDINKHEQVLHVGLTYLNVEDEAERMGNGQEGTWPFGFKKPGKK